MSIDFVSIPSEEDEQKTLVEWLMWHRIRFCHVPNGGYRTKREGAKFKRLGVQKGMVDILIFDPPPACPENVGVAIELKRQKGGRVTPEQIAWLEDLKARGWAVAVCQGAMEAIRVLQELGFGGRT
ncbi:VRR-NUC domain-containing protein [Candidatus Darwinibacter acetoxidans]